MASTNHLQAVSQQMFDGKVTNLLLLLNDILLHEKSESGVIEFIEQFLSTTSDVSFKIQRNHTSQFLLETKLFRSIITADVHKFYPPIGARGVVLIFWTMLI